MPDDESIGLHPTVSHRETVAELTRFAAVAERGAGRIVGSAEILRKELVAQVAMLDEWERECTAGL